jgi:hypothetical protein
MIAALPSVADHSRLTKLCVYLFIVFLSIAPESVTIEGKNVLLIVYAFAGMVVLTLMHFKSLPSMRNDWLVMLIVYFVAVSAWNIHSTQPLSLAYAIFFIGSFIYYFSFSRHFFNLADYRNILKFLLLLYLVGVLIGQVIVYLNLFVPVKELAAGTFQGGFHSIIENGGFRYYSFSSEPSYASFIVITLFYSLVVSNPDKKASLLQGENLLFFIVLTYILIMTRSGYGMVLYFIILMSFIGFNRRALLAYLIIAITGLILAFALEDFGPLVRLEKIWNYTDLTNLHSLRTADFNVYIRIAPVLFYFDTHAWTDLHLFLGHGAGASRNFVTPEIYYAYPPPFVGGFLPAFFYDYGLIGVGLVFVYLYHLIPRLFSIQAAVILLLLLNANMSTQLFWLILFCLAMNKHFRDSEDVSTSSSLQSV